MIDRRALLAGAAAMATDACVPLRQDQQARWQARFRILEASVGGTLHVCALDTETGESLGWRDTERYPHCSSFKFSLAALLLQKAAQGEVDADERVTWTREDLLPVSPFTTQRLASGATLRELAHAAQTTSDNAAANILLRKLGGPEAVTAFWRATGDPVSRLDRYEMELNNVPADEIRDTTTAQAMAATVGSLLFGNVLPAADRLTLAEWMAATKTGLRRVRAGFPESWNAGDKTGTSFWPGMRHAYVDIGFANPPGGPAITFATCLRTREGAQRIDAAAERILQQTGAIIAAFAQR